MSDLMVDGDRVGGTPQRWSALQHALIYQWLVGAWLLGFVGVLTMVIGTSSHNVWPIALLLIALIGGPFVPATLAKRRRRYRVAAACCLFGAVLALLPGLIVFALAASDSGPPGDRGMLNLLEFAVFNAAFVVPSVAVSWALLGMGNALRRAPAHPPVLGPTAGGPAYLQTGHHEAARSNAR